jgi:hypothetical protein
MPYNASALYTYAWAGQLQQFTHISMQLPHGHSSALGRSGFSRTLSSM